MSEPTLLMHFVSLMSLFRRLSSKSEFLCYVFAVLSAFSNTFIRLRYANFWPIYSRCQFIDFHSLQVLPKEIFCCELNEDNKKSIFLACWSITSRKSFLRFWLPYLPNVRCQSDQQSVSPKISIQPPSIKVFLEFLVDYLLLYSIAWCFQQSLLKSDLG